MKKSLLIVITMLFVFFVLASCTTVNASKLFYYSQEEAQYALTQALRMSCSSAVEKLSNQLSSMDFIPHEYENIKTEMNNIPGMKTLINKYNASVADLVESSLYEFKYYISDLIETLDFEDPEKLINSSDSSASEYFFETYGSTIKDTVNTFFENADLSDLISCIRQYNAYVTTRKNSLGKSSDLIGMENYTSYLTNIIYDRFYKFTADSEELFRTTPDPYVDEITAMVFGIN